MREIITTHRNADFDALASLTAATLIYPDAVAVLPRQVNPNVRAFLSIHKDLFEFPRAGEADLADCRRLIVVDANAWGRLDRFDGLKARPDLTVEVWDHHPGRGDLAPAFACRETTGANITLMIRALKEKRTLITPIQATLFLMGLYEDTGNLTFGGTCPEDAMAAAYLLDRKADLVMVNRFLNPVYGPKQKDALFEMLKSARRRKVNGFRIGLGRLAVEGHVDNLAVVVSMYMDIVNVDAAFGLFESRQRGKCMVIGRSGNEALNIGQVMRALGGGGHPAAGSAVLRDISAAAAEELILELIQGNQQSSVRVSDLMSYPVFTIEAETTMDAAGKILHRKGCTGLPVVKDDRLVGILSRRDFKRLKNEKQLARPVKTFMSTAVKSIGPAESPLSAAQRMVKYDIGRLPVLQDGKIIGIVTRSDTMRYFYDLLPD